MLGLIAQGRNLGNRRIAQEEQRLRELEAPNRTADAWSSIMEQMKPVPDSDPVAGSLYKKQGDSTVQGSVLDALTQSPQAKKAHSDLNTPEKLSPLERVQKQIDLMMKSGDPALQERAMDLIGTNKGTSGMQEYNYAKSQGYDGSFTDYKALTKASTNINLNGGAKTGKLTAEQLKEGGFEPDANAYWGKDGLPTILKTTGFTESQQKAAAFAETMQSSEDDMQSLMESGYDPTTFQQQAGNIPLVGSYFTTGEQQLMNRSQDGWVRAKLRDESGASIGKEEMRMEKLIYFPQPKDGPLVIAAKKRARQVALNSMRTKSGGKFKPHSKEERAAIRNMVSKQIDKARNEEPWTKFEKDASGIWKNGSQIWDKAMQDKYGPTPDNLWDEE